VLVHQILCDLTFPLVTVGEKLLLVIQELTVRLGGVLVVGTLDNSIDGTSLLTESAVDTLGHVNIVPRGSTSTVLTFLDFNGNGLRRASGFAQLAGDATFFTGRVAAKRVFATKASRERSLLERVVDRSRGAQKDFSGQPPSTKDLRQKENLGGVIKNLGPGSLQNMLETIQR
jgi:hypothetical protein